MVHVGQHARKVLERSGVAMKMSRWSRFKLSLIHVADWIDSKILCHQFYWLCNLIGMSSWWGPEGWDCPCKRCTMIRRELAAFEKEMAASDEEE